MTKQLIAAHGLARGEYNVWLRHLYKETNTARRTMHNRREIDFQNQSEVLKYNIKETDSQQQSKLQYKKSNHKSSFDYNVEETNLQKQSKLQRDWVARNDHFVKRR